MNLAPPSKPSFSYLYARLRQTHTDMSQLEKKKQEWEMLQEHRKNFQAQMDFLSQQQAQELEQLTQDLHKTGFNPGHQSEPTTPPEHRDQGFSSVFSRSNRYSSASLTSPPGLNTRSSRSGSQITSPPSELAQTLHNHINSDTLPSRSVPGSRRGSNDRFAAYVPETNGSARRNAAA